MDSPIFGPLIARFALERRDFGETVKEFMKTRTGSGSYNIEAGNPSELTEATRVWMDAKSTSEGRAEMRRRKVCANKVFSTIF